MIGTNICIIDDGFMLPAKDLNMEGFSYFSGSAISALVSVDWDKDEPLKAFCQAVLEKKNGDQPIWSLAGFRLPQFFREAFDLGKYRADLIVFDWEYLGIEVDQVKELKFILESTHSYIVIFTGADKGEAIKLVLKDDLSAYADRIKLLDKKDNGASQHEQLLHLLEQKQMDNFAFKFGTKLRAGINSSLDTVLHRLSCLDINRVIDILSENDNDPVDADLKEMIGEKLKNGIKSNSTITELLTSASLSPEVAEELLELIAETVKTDVISLELEHAPEASTEADPNDDAVVKALWSYRLYHDPLDNVVRCGDIIEKEGGDGSKLYLVITPPCDLAKFWKKTDGRLVVVELLDIDQNKINFRKNASLFKNLTKIRKDFETNGVSSFTNGAKLNSNLPGRPYLVPLVPVRGGLQDFILNAHSIESFRIDIPDALQRDGQRNELSSTTLRYEHINFQRKTKISDPFCGPLIGSILSDLTGWGVADYPNSLKVLLGSKLSKVFQAIET